MRQLTIAILVALTLAACADPNAYAVPDKQQWTDIGTAVRDYYALRNQLTAGLTVEDFWRTYPDLGYEHDLRSGINLEVMLWKWSHDPQLVRLNYRTDIESYQPVRVFVRPDDALVYVHGLEIWDHRTGPSTSGEFRTVLSLKLRDGHRTVVRTDEQMLGERPPKDPPVR